MRAEQADLASLLADARGREVLVVGDLMLDHFVIGRVDRISPEAPVPVVQFDHESFRLGGAANVAHNLAALGGKVEIAGVGRLSKDRGLSEAEFAILIADSWQRHGLGTELLRRLVRIGRDEGLDRIWAEMLASNAGMRHASTAAGFTVRGAPDEPTLMLAELDLL